MLSSRAIYHRVTMVGLRPSGIRLQRGGDATDVDVPAFELCCKVRENRGGVGVGKEVEGLSPCGVVPIAPKLKDKLAFLSLNAVFDDEQLILWVLDDVASLDPAAVGSGRIEDVADLKLTFEDSGGCGDQRRCHNRTGHEETSY
ncbi:predicted protein [Chaetomium globosum CBS 148.51]|uniref:Uncharacterized protein n=1 Tax=Chaetomium globosum (strain ATCC 6205 / CBS 148.51 / DSM 1962 / NBRC 6347 / NRRL 1970) TaxID=306901 RepID=Q2GUL8_CHAGB|nr:uncharacterized protein CHGG_08336 [Chaetomium globosum CBS 148.51]EAQ84322.1 predicted protein [Chaetomium globosum CBS 148.51]